MGFVNNVINHFERKEHHPMIPSYLFNDFELKHIVLIVRMQTLLKLMELKAFTKEKYDFRIVWKTNKVRQFFPLKEKESISLV